MQARSSHSISVTSIRECDVLDDSKSDLEASEYEFDDVSESSEGSFKPRKSFAKRLKERMLMLSSESSETGDDEETRIRDILRKSGN